MYSTIYEGYTYMALTWRLYTYGTIFGFVHICHYIWGFYIDISEYISYYTYSIYRWLKEQNVKKNSHSEK